MTLRRAKPFWSKKVNNGPDPNSFIMTFTLGASDSITLPLVNGGTYNFTVEWGDGTSNIITSWNQAERTHTYTGRPAGDVTISIIGTCPGWGFGTVTTSRTKLKTVNQWGDVGFNSVNFNGCSALNNLPRGLKTTGTSLASCFQDCTALSTVDSNLFEFCTSVTNFSQVFYKTTAGNFTIPSGLFNNCTSATNFSLMFFRCRFTTIPADLFRFNTAVTNLLGCFAGNNLLTTVPTDLFRYNTAVTIFGNANTLFGLFSNCTSLTSLPTDLFRYNTSVTSFENVFNSCTGLTSLPEDLFRYNTSVTSFASTFQSCNGLTTVPADLFRYNTSVTSFSQTFYAISNVSFTVPATLFQYNVNVNSFFGCFYNTRFTTIPTDLFRYNTAVTNFAACFGNMPNLVTVPVDLFRYNTAVTIFGNSNNLFGVFNRSPLASIPSDIFRYNTLCTNYQNVFFNCTNLATSVSDIVLNMDMTAVTTTNQMFSGCTNLTGNGQDLIDKPKAAGYTVGTDTNTGSYRTFFNCTGLTDFATIPAAYK
jgi:hypothetical protein